MGYANTYQLCILANRLLQNVLACEILTFRKTSVTFCAGGREWVNLNERRSNILILFVYSFIYLFSTYSP